MTCSKNLPNAQVLDTYMVKCRILTDKVLSPKVDCFINFLITAVDTCVLSSSLGKALQF